MFLRSPLIYNTVCMLKALMVISLVYGLSRWLRLLFFYKASNVALTLLFCEEVGIACNFVKGNIVIIWFYRDCLLWLWQISKKFCWLPVVWPWVDACSWENCLRGWQKLKLAPRSDSDFKTAFSFLLPSLNMQGSILLSGHLHSPARRNGRTSSSWAMASGWTWLAMMKLLRV